VTDPRSTRYFAHLRLRQRVLSSATPSVLGDFTHHSIKKEAAVAKFSSGRMGARPPPPVGLSGGPRPAANRVPPGPGPAPLALPTAPIARAQAAPAGPERHCRERRGPSAGDGLGNRGAIRAGLLCRDREHGGTQAVSRRSGSPREAQSEGPKVLLFLLGRAREASDRTRRAGEPRGASRRVPTGNPAFRYVWIRGNWGSER
jgi:hypothetical protein